MWFTLLPALVCLLTAIWLWRGRLLKDRYWWSGMVVAAACAITLIILVVRQWLPWEKVIAHLVMPEGLFWLLLIAISTAAWARRTPWQGAVWTGVTVLYTAMGSPWIGAALIGSLERSVPRFQPDPAHPLDAIFVLGGGTSITPDGAPQLGSAGDRVALAAELWHDHDAPILVTSGSSIAGLETDRDLSAETSAIWQHLGIPANAIHMLPGPRTTAEEIQAYHDLIAKQGWHRCGLVSSGWHLPRALALCQRAGLAMVPIAADQRGRMPNGSPLWLVPQRGGFVLVDRAMWEILGRMVGH